MSHRGDLIGLAIVVPIVSGANSDLLNDIHRVVRNSVFNVTLNCENELDEQIQEEQHKGQVKKKLEIAE